MEYLSKILSFVYFWSMLLAVSVGCRYGSAPNCGFQCRCNANEQCDPNTGICSGPNDCGPDVPYPFTYHGSGCRIGNLAYGKTATQGRTHRNREAIRAIDGNAGTAEGTCMAVFMASVTDKAWWMVNLGKIHSVLGTIIYNNFNFKDRTNNFEIKVGSTNRIDDQTLCASYANFLNNDVIYVMCSRTLSGQYVSFRKIGGEEPDRANFCEFVVRGYEIVDCSYCNTSCSPQTGCSKCSAGKKLPDCRDFCPSGYWGVNCNMTCGHCAENQACKKVNSHCDNGCSGWYLPPHCTRYIDIPDISSSNVTTTGALENSLTVAWELYTSLDTDFDEYYFYKIQYGMTSNGLTKITGEIAHGNRNSDMSAHYRLENLQYDTEYIIQILVYRRLLNKTEVGIGSKNITARTLCNKQQTPALTLNEDHDTVSFTRQALLNTSCDVVVNYSLHAVCNPLDTAFESVSLVYRVDVSMLTTYTFPVAIDMHCKIWLEVLYEANISISTEPVHATFFRKKSLETDTGSSSTVPNEQDRVNNITSPPNVSQPELGRNDGSGEITSIPLIVGCIVGAAGLIMLIVGIILTIRSRNRPPNSGNSQITSTDDHESTKTTSEDKMYYNIASESVQVDKMYYNVPDEVAERSQHKGVNNGNEQYTVADQHNPYESVDSKTRDDNPVSTVYQTLS